MSSLLERLPGHVILFTGIVVMGVSATFVYANTANVLAWGGLLYGVLSALVGVTVMTR